MGKRKKRLTMARYAKKYAKVRSLIAAKLEKTKEDAMADGIVTEQEAAEINKLEVEVERLRVLEEAPEAEQEAAMEEKEVVLESDEKEPIPPKPEPAVKRKPRAKKAPTAKRKPRKTRAPKKTE
jgi:hypothetical protein